MIVNTSKRLLGIACTSIGMFLPAVLAIVATAYPEIVYNPLHETKLTHFTNPLILTVIAITVLVNVRGALEASGRGRTSLEQLPRNAATMLTGAVGMVLLFIYLTEEISFSNRVSSTAALFVYAMSSAVLLMEACCLLSSGAEPPPIASPPSGEVKTSPKE